LCAPPTRRASAASVSNSSMMDMPGLAFLVFSCMFSFFSMRSSFTMYSKPCEDGHSTRVTSGSVKPVSVIRFLPVPTSFSSLMLIESAVAPWRRSDSWGVEGAMGAMKASATPAAAAKMSTFLCIILRGCGRQTSGERCTCPAACLNTPPYSQRYIRDSEDFLTEICALVLRGSLDLESLDGSLITGSLISTLRRRTGATPKVLNGVSRSTF